MAGSAQGATVAAHRLRVLKRGFDDPRRNTLPHHLTTTRCRIKTRTPGIHTPTRFQVLSRTHIRNMPYNTRNNTPPNTRNTLNKPSIRNTDNTRNTRLLAPSLTRIHFQTQRRRPLRPPGPPPPPPPPTPPPLSPRPPPPGAQK